MPDHSKSICLAGAEGMVNQEETPALASRLQESVRTGRWKEAIEEANKEQCAFLFSHFEHEIYTYDAYESQHLRSNNKTIYFGLKERVLKT